MTHEEIKSRIRTFLSRFFRSVTLQDDDDIFAMGFVNSMVSMQLVSYLESEFDITIADEDLDISNFTTIRAMADLVVRKQTM